MLLPRSAILLASTVAALVDLPCAQTTVRMLADINTAPTPPASSSPRDFVRVGPWTMFTADDGRHGRELFRTNGNPATTGMVADVRPGPEGSGLTLLNDLGDGRLWFTAGDGVHGWEPWLSDGTAAGTRMLVDLAPGTASSGVGAAALVGGRIVFVTRDALGVRLWSSDGSAAGTVLLLDGRLEHGPDALELLGVVDAASATAAALLLVRHGDRWSTWRSDGTAFGTTQVSALPWSSVQLPYMRAVVVTGSAVIAAFNWATGRVDLCRFATSAQQTSIVSRAGSGLGPSGKAYFDGRAWFGFFDGTFGLIATDGTPQGTSSLQVAGIERYHGFLGVLGGSLWAIGATSRDVRLLRIDRGMAPVDVGPLPGWTVNGRAELGDRRLGTRFVYRYEESGRSELRVLDPFIPDERVLLASDPGPISLGVGRAYFSTNDPTVGHELAVTDGTAAGTHILADLASTTTGTRGSFPVRFTAVGRRTAFFAEGSSGSVELWFSDGTAQGTHLVMSGLAGVPLDVTVVGDRLFFAVGTPQRLYVSDGSPSGTVELTIPIDLTPHWPLPLGDELIGLGSDAGVPALVATDGITARRVATLGGNDAHRFGVRVGDLVFYRTSVPAPVGRIASLWASDGTAAGTRLVGNFPIWWGAGFVDQLPSLAVLGDEVVFAAAAPDGRYELWASDGAPGAARLITRIGDPQSRFTALRFTSVRDKLFIVSSLGDGWVTDGTAAGTSALPPFMMRSVPTDLWPIGDRVLFHAVEGTHWTVWASDGTAAGTVRLSMRYDTAQQHLVTGLERRAVYSAFDNTTRQPVLMVTDGTPAGTMPLIAMPLVAPQRPSEWRWQHAGSSNGLLYFGAVDPVLGAEPHVLELGAAVQQLSPGCGGAGREANLRATVFGGHRGGFELYGRASHGRVAALLASAPPAGPTSFPAAGRCQLDVDLAFAAVLAALPISADHFGRVFPLPDDPALHGLQLVV